MPVVANYDSLDELIKAVVAVFAETDSLMRPASVARKLGISRQAVHQLLTRGTIRSIVIDGLRFAYREDVSRYKRLDPSKSPTG